MEPVGPRAKSRLATYVAGWDVRNRNHYRYTRKETPSVTISDLHLSLMTAISDPSGKCLCVTADIGCVYVNAHMPQDDSDKLHFIHINAGIAAMLVEVDPRMVPHMHKGGSIIAELNRPLHTCIDGPIYASRPHRLTYRGLEV